MADIHRSETMVAPALRTLLEDTVDYAGIFPPAALSLDEAVANYARFGQSPEAWMLGRFVLPAERLADLEPYAHFFDPDAPFRFSVLAGSGDDAPGFLESTKSDLDAVASFKQRYGDGVSIDAFEMRIPGDLLMTDVVTVGRFINDVDALLERHHLQAADLFFEVPLDQNLRQTIPIVAGAIHAFNRDRTIDEHGVAALKMRTGGTEAEAFPPAENVAFFIAACRDAGIRFKATAGLHHPLRQFSDDVDAWMHGFVNVFVAAALATAEHADEAEIVSVLTDGDASSFSFDEEAIRWKGHRVSRDIVERTRRDRAISFGSCSFGEPVEDLRNLGLL